MSALTEKEAKTKACCNGASRPATNGICIASECMAWRFTGAAKITADTGRHVAVGYCGLAGSAHVDV
jgi:hypothetical protein